MKWLITLMLLAMAAGCGSEAGVGSTDAGITQSDGSGSVDSIGSADGSKDSTKEELPSWMFYASVTVETPDGLPADIKVCGGCMDAAGIPFVVTKGVAKLEIEVGAGDDPKYPVIIEVERQGYAFLKKKFFLKKSDPKVVILAADWLPGQWGVDMGGALYKDSHDNSINKISGYVDWKDQVVYFKSNDQSIGLLHGKKILSNKEKLLFYNGEFSSDLSVITYSASNVNGLKWSGTLTRVK